MAELTERQKIILALVIRDYIEQAQPVGSNYLLETYGLKFSSATIRNEMVALTDLGLLRQPHTSAGRVPTEEGYRYAQQSQGASLVTAPHPEQPVFKHIELIATHGRQVLLVLVLAAGEVSQQMLALAEPVAQERLSASAARLNNLLAGLSPDEIAATAIPQDALERDILRLISDDMRRLGAVITGEVYRDGLTHVLAEPEFSEMDSARSALRILEERPLLEDLFNRTMINSEMGGVQVLIGGEGAWQELREFSMVLARYGVPGLATGMLGVLGPIRMPYGRAISTVRFVASLLSNLVEDLHAD
ncbi:MAG: hrcA [Chloroflexi bacterium]|nr:hrcA [Chloroflexota bacterium]